MTTKDKQCKPHRIYLKSSKEWVEVTEKVYRPYIRECDATRKRNQSHGRCVCPRKKFWLCDADCLNCEFQRAGDTLSLDYELTREDSDALTMLDTLADPSPSTEDIVADLDELSMLLHRLAELMPEAIKVGVLREQGMNESAIAAELGIPRTTLRSRLKKSKEQLASEFPDLL